MKFFIDTADLGEIEEAAALGVLDGVTTNPSLMKAAGRVSFHDHILRICQLVEGDVSAEVTAPDFDTMLEQGRTLAALHPRVVVKVPLTRAGIKAIKVFADEGIRTNCTLCFSASQALIAAKAGASYISPFIGRLDDISHEGLALIRQIVAIYGRYGYATEVLAASIRHPLHVVESALAGADVATMPLKVIEQLLAHPLTDLGMARFTQDWDSYQAALEHNA